MVFCMFALFLYSYNVGSSTEPIQLIIQYRKKFNGPIKTAKRMCQSRYELNEMLYLRSFFEAHLVYNTKVCTIFNDTEPMEYRYTIN